MIFLVYLFKKCHNSGKINDFNSYSIRNYNYLTISAGETAEFHKYKLNFDTDEWKIDFLIIARSIINNWKNKNQKK